MFYDRQVYESAMEFLKAYRRSVPEQPLFWWLALQPPPSLCLRGGRCTGNTRSATVKECETWAEIPALSFYGGYRQECSGERIETARPPTAVWWSGWTAMWGAVYDRFVRRSRTAGTCLSTPRTTGAAGQTQKFWKTGPVRGRARRPWWPRGPVSRTACFHGTVSLLDVSRTVLAASGGGRAL